MPSTAVAFATQAFSVITTFAVLIAVTTLIAFFAAQAWGGASRRRRQAIYSIVGFVGLVFAAVFTQYRLRHFIA